MEKGGAREDAGPKLKLVKAVVLEGLSCCEKVGRTCADALGNKPATIGETSAVAQFLVQDSGAVQVGEPLELTL